MVPKVKVPTTKPDNLSGSPRTHMMEAKNRQTHIVLWPLPNPVEYEHLYPHKVHK